MRQRVICRVCGKVCAGRLPKGGDGSLLYPWRHLANGQPCGGALEEGDWTETGEIPGGSEVFQMQPRRGLSRIDDLRDAWKRLVEEGTAGETRRGREGALRYFGAWAAFCGVEVVFPLDAELVLRFVVEHQAHGDGEMDLVSPDVVERLITEGFRRKRGALAVATIEARWAHLSALHELAHVGPNPCRHPLVIKALQAARNIRARKGGQKQVQGITREVLDAMVAVCDPETPAGLRDRALFLVAFGSGGRRRSELSRARVEDLREVGEDYVLRIPWSKADQEGDGLEVPCVGRVARALRLWLEATGIRQGPIFRRLSKGGRVFSEKGLSGQGILAIVRKRLGEAGYDAQKFGAHSFRVGFITTGADLGVPLLALTALSGHKNLATAGRYYQGGSSLKSEAARLAG